MKADHKLRFILGVQRSSTYKAFYRQYRKGFKRYVNGKWGEARMNLENCLAMKPQDGPSKQIYEYMENFEFCSERAQWNGFRNCNEQRINSF